MVSFLDQKEASVLVRNLVFLRLCIAAGDVNLSLALTWDSCNHDRRANQYQESRKREEIEVKKINKEEMNVNTPSDDTFSIMQKKKVSMFQWKLQCSMRQTHQYHI